MKRSLIAAFGVFVAVALAARVRSYHPALLSADDRSPGLPTQTTVSPTPAAVARSAPRAISTNAPSSDVKGEASLMEHLRSADPATVIALAREGNDRYPDGTGAEEREARKIDALVALDDIGEAHSEAMLFVQHHPSGPFTAHVANLMGVHPRPPGAVPEPAAHER